MLLCRASAMLRQGAVRWSRVRLLRSTTSCALHSGDTSKNNKNNAAVDSKNAPSDSKYRETVLLPKTELPMKLAGQKLLDKELEIQKVCICIIIYMLSFFSSSIQNMCTICTVLLINTYFILLFFLSHM